MLKYRNIFYDFVPVNNYIQSRYFLLRFNRITRGLNDSIKQKLITFYQHCPNVPKKSFSFI